MEYCLFCTYQLTAQLYCHVIPAREMVFMVVLMFLTVFCLFLTSRVK